MDPLTPKSNEIRRTPIVLLVCVLSSLGAAFTLVGLLMPGIRNPLAQQSPLGIAFLPLAFLQLGLNIAAIVSLWKMRKYGVYLYAGLAIWGFVFDAITGVFHVTNYVIPAVLILLLLMSLKKMR